MPAHGRCPGPQMRREMRLRSRSSGRTARTDPASRAPSPDSPWPASAGIPSSSRKPNLLPCSPAAEGEPCLRWSSEPVQSFSAARAQRPSECLPAAVTPTEIIKERRKTGLTDGLPLPSEAAVNAAGMAYVRSVRSAESHSGGKTRLPAFRIKPALLLERPQQTLPVKYPSADRWLEMFLFFLKSTLFDKGTKYKSSSYFSTTKIK